MNFLRLLPVFVSFLLLAAHYLRAGQTLILFILAGLLLLLFVKKYWVPWLMQLTLLLGAVEWIHTLVTVAQMRIELDKPWVRMGIILGAVAIFTLFSGLVFRSRALRMRYNADLNNPGE